MFSSALQSFAGWVREQWHAHRVATIAEREVGISDALHLLEDTQSETDAVTDPYRQNQRIRSARYEARSSYGRYLSFGDDHHWHATHSRDYENFVAEEGQGVVEEIDQAYDDLRHERDMAQREADSALGQFIQIATLLIFASNPEVLAEGALGAGTRASLTRFGSSDSPLLVRPRGLFHPPGVAGSRPIVAADEGELVEFIQPRLGRAVQARTAQAVGRAGLTGESRAAGGLASTADDLTSAAARARATVGPGRGPVYGTRAHSAFRAEVEALGRGNLSTEVSYLNGRVVPYGTRGSVRLDVVEGPLNAPTAIFDFKTGSATLSPARINQIRSHLPGGGGNVPVLEIR